MCTSSVENRRMMQTHTYTQKFKSSSTQCTMNFNYLSIKSNNFILWFFRKYISIHFDNNRHEAHCPFINSLLYFSPYSELKLFTGMNEMQEKNILKNVQVWCYVITNGFRERKKRVESTDCTANNGPVGETQRPLDLSMKLQFSILMQFFVFLRSKTEESSMNGKLFFFFFLFLLFILNESMWEALLSLIEVASDP